MDSVHRRSVKQLVSSSLSLFLIISCSRSAASRSVSVCDCSDASSKDAFHIKALAARLETLDLLIDLITNVHVTV